MSATIEYLEAVKLKTGATSDYQLAKVLESSRGGISSYRTGRTHFDDLMCLKVADILEVDPLLVISEIHAERAKSEKEREVWRNLFQKIGGVAATFLIATGINVATPSPASAAAPSMAAESSGSMYIMLN